MSAPPDEGEPVRELLGLKAPPVPDLEARVLAAVRRRESVIYTAGFAWGAVAAVVRAVLDAVGSLVGADEQPEKEP